jgi:hypothetical protein
MDPVLAARIAGQGLAVRGGDPLDALRSWAVQDSPPGSAITALVARAEEVPAGWLDDALYERRSAVALYNARTATAVVPADEVAAYATALLPADDAGLKALVGTALPEQDEGYAEPVELAVEAISEALDGRTLSRDDLHERLRQRLPRPLLPWCAGCKSHHARRGLLVMAGLRGRLCIAGRAGRQPAFARTDQLVGWEPPDRREAGAELVRRYLRGYGPSTPAEFAQWAGLGKAHARELWALAEFEAVEPEPAEGVRLLATGDPLLLGRDRERLVPDPAARKQVWAASGGAGIVLVDGEARALWRARKQGKRLELTVEDDVPQRALRAEAERLAPHRGCTSVEFAR